MWDAYVWCSRFLFLCLSLCQILLLFSQKQSGESRVALISRVTQRRCLAGWHDVRILIILKCHFTRRSLSCTSALDYCELDVFRLPESQPAYHSHSLGAERPSRPHRLVSKLSPFCYIEYRRLQMPQVLLVFVWSKRDARARRDLKFESHQTGIRASRKSSEIAIYDSIHTPSLLSADTLSAISTGNLALNYI